MKKSIYEFDNYKTFLNTFIEQMPSHGRGVKKKLANALGCQGPFITQVLSGNLDFSMEHAVGIAQFLGMNQSETEHLVLLVSYNRAGTNDLKKLLYQSIEQAREKRKLIKNRMNMKEAIDKESEVIYYSSWHYQAVHMALTIPGLNSREAISQKLKLPLKKVDDVLHFLTEKNLIKKNMSKYEVTDLWLHLDKSSPMISKHHTNLRIKSIQSMDNIQKSDLHYSAIFSCANKDLLKLQEMLLKTLSDFNELVRPSKEEELACFNLDFFKI